MSDAIQFLMERDRASLQMRQKAQKMRLFDVSGGFSALPASESQRKKADLRGFWPRATARCCAKPTDFDVFGRPRRIILSGQTPKACVFRQEPTKNPSS